MSTLLGFDGLGLPDGQFLSSTGSLVFGKQADLCQVRCALDNKFLRVNGFTISLLSRRKYILYATQYSSLTS